MSKKTLFMCAPEFIESDEDVRLIAADNEEECLKELITIGATDEYFRTFVEDITINSGLPSVFFETYSTSIEEAILKMKEFFAEDKGYFEMYLDYYKNPDMKPPFPFEFYEYCLYKLMGIDAWDKFKIKKVSEITVNDTKDVVVLH